MKRYQVFIDVPKDGDWENEIDVITIEVEADNPNMARDLADNIASDSYEAYYVWEVREDDEILAFD